jgi:hypothetical protein
LAVWIRAQSPWITTQQKGNKTMKKTTTNPLGITITYSWRRHNPNMPNSENMDNWHVTLHNPNNKRTMTVCFSKGYGHKGAHPTANEVLYCLVSDSDCMDYDFEEWAENMGYDPDSRKAEKTFNVCKRQTEKLIKFIDSEEDMEALREWASNY